MGSNFKKSAAVLFLFLAVSLTACASKPENSQTPEPRKTAEQTAEITETPKTSEETVENIFSAYEKTENHGNRLLLGIKNNGKELFLLNPDGKPYIDIAFDEFKDFGDGNFSAVKDNVHYIFKTPNKELVVDYMGTTRTVYGFEATVNLMIKDNDLKYFDEFIPLVDRTIEFLTAPEDAETETGRKKAEFFNGRTLESLFNFNILPFLYNDPNDPRVQIIAYAMFDGSEHKTEIAVDFLKDENGEYTLSNIYKAD